MEKYIPDIYQKSIYAINYDNLIKRGIKCILFDLDNTLVPPNIKLPNKKLQTFIEDLKKKTNVVIFSNCSDKRLKNFIQTLNIDGYSKVHKPFNRKLIEVMSKYELRVSEVAIIGDQLLTDIYLGNSAGITTILVNPVSKNEQFITKFNRIQEKKIMKKLRDRDLFLVGRYYE